MLLSTRERILAIRLLEKVKAHPVYAKELGIVTGKEYLRLQAKTNS